MQKNKQFNLSDDQVQRWKDFSINGQNYAFDHLVSCKHTFFHPDRNEKYTLFFTFSHHVFTRSKKENESTVSTLIYPYRSDERVFDVVRFDLSKHLPNIIKNLPDQFCYHGGYSRYCSCPIPQEDGVEIHYKIVYRVWKKKGKMRFHIESAYPLEERPGKVKKVSFWVICHNLLNGKPMPQPASK